MTGIGGISAYQQMNKAIQNAGKGAERANDAALSKTSAPKVEEKTLPQINSKSSLIPQKTEYGYTVGEVKLSDKAKDYYEKLKAKFHNLEFIAVSKDMKAQAQQNAAIYGNAKKMVVLIDEEKLERMATDESFRKKYEGIIAMSQNKITEAKNSLASTGAKITNFGMSVDSNGKESFFATVEKSQDLQRQRIEKKTEEKREAKVKEKKHADKLASEKRLLKAKEKRAEFEERLEERKTEKAADLNEVEKPFDKAKMPFDKAREYTTFTSDSVDALISNVQAYSYSLASDRVVTDAERMVGGNFDFKG